MTVQHWLQSATSQLSSSGIGTARLDCLVLLEDATGKSRAHLLAHPEMDLDDKEQNVLNKALRQRSKHVPLSYIRGKTEFYGREFIVNKYVLEPRPESETIIDLLKDFASANKKRIGRVIDVGTGSGALAITAQYELPTIAAIGIDIDQNCIQVATKNATLHTSAATFLEGDLLRPIFADPIPPNDAILANLPYVPNTYRINPSANHEPRRAIFGGVDGLDFYRRLFGQIASNTTKPIVVFTESLPFQHIALKEIAKTAGFIENARSDFIQEFVLL